MRERDIFIEALEKGDPSERAAWLDEACRTDVDLRGRVERLLAEHDRQENFILDSPLAGIDVTADIPVIERPGTIIGPYKLLQQIGEGGFGVVFLAEQERPVRRRVALKVIKPGMDTREVIARFEAERQALAMMDHPNIAKVLDAGTTGGSRDKGQESRARNESSLALDSRPSTLDYSAGRPYFVMELVRGVPITEYCDRCNLTARERLELFVTVCQAVQHAHQKGVIHRDIKPTNVLVAIQDGQPAPKIIDFGVAKAIDQQLTEHTLMTAFAQIIGTPLYMSPEQAELSALGVDTRSDIYSLGVLLYELLTGTTPFDKDRLHAASYDELRRIIREEEPPRPSARLSTLAADLAITIAEHRRTEPRRLQQAVRGELDWIVMKCLEKDRNRRYETAGSLARDVERYLHDQPVQACPPSAAYRLRKFARRHKIAAAFVLLLTAATAALGVSNVRTRISERRAITENAKAQAVSDLLQGMLRSANPDEVKDAEYTVRQLLDDFSAGFGSGLADQPEVEAEIRATIGRTYWRLGVADKAEPHLMRALELRRSVFGADHQRVADVLVDIAWCRNEQARFPEAEDAAREALRIYRACGATGAPLLQAMTVLQRVLILSQRLDEADALTKEALACAKSSGVDSPEIPILLHGQADMYVVLGRYRDAETVARKAVELHRRLHGPGHPETAWGLLALGNTLKMQQRFAEAEPPIREALAIFRQRYRGKHHSVVSASIKLREVLTALGDQAGLDTLANDEADQEMRSNVPDYNFRLANLLLSNHPTGAQKQEARRLVRRAIESYQQMAMDARDDLSGRLKAADGYVGVAELYAADPDFAQETEDAHRRLSAELKSLLERFPDSSQCQEEVGLRYRAWAAAVLNQGDYLAQCEQAYRDAIRLFERLALSDPTRPRFWFCLANSYTYLGEVYWRSGRLADAEMAYAQAIKIFAEHPAEIARYSTGGATTEIVGNYCLLADYLARTHREARATDLVHKAEQSVQRTRDSNALAEGRYCLALMQLQLGDDQGYRATCEALVAEGLGSLSGITKSRPVWTPCIGPDAVADPSLPVRLGEELHANNTLELPHFVLLLLGAAHYRAGQFDEAASRLTESIAAYPSGLRPETDSVNYHRLFLAMSKWQLGQRDEARQLLAETLPAVDHERHSPSSGWNRRLTLEILRREAEELIGQKELGEAVETKSRTDVKPKQPSTLNPES